MKLRRAVSGANNEVLDGVVVARTVLALRATCDAVRAFMDGNVFYLLYRRRRFSSCGVLWRDI